MTGASPVATRTSQRRLIAMVRAALLGVLIVVAAPACGSKDATPAVQPGAVAGKVLEVSGSVRVGMRTLAVGDQVKSDEAIETGSDGDVVIELAHNQVRWELGPNRKVKPIESAAWTATRSGSAPQVDQDTSAAGRPAERSAADTSTSAKSAAPPEVPGALPPPAPTAAPAPAPPPPPAVEPEVARGVAPGRGGTERAKDDEAPPSQSAAAPAKPRPLVGQGAASGGGALADADDPIDPLSGLATCLPEGARLRIKVHVAKHVPAVTFVDAVDAKVKACITTAAKKLSLAVESGDLALTLRR
jgi:hypothetical protein